MLLARKAQQPEMHQFHSYPLSHSQLIDHHHMHLYIKALSIFHNLPFNNDMILNKENDKPPPSYYSSLIITRFNFQCDLPEPVRRRRIFSQPMLVTSTSETELLKWNFLVYESFSTKNDVVVFAKGVNHRNGDNRSPEELRCVFDLGSGVLNVAVTSSVQEVFRCPHPDPSELDLDSHHGLPNRIGISLEIVAENIINAPSVAYYIPRPKPMKNALAVQARPEHFLCACTMVYNVAKVLREWVMYHAKVGMENFVLYDNASDDDLYSVIEELGAQGDNIN